MIKKRSHFAFVLLAGALSVSAQAQVKPSAPTKVCIQNDSGPSSCANISSGSQTKKWNPGHYVRANSVGYARSNADRLAAYNQIRNEPLIKGGLISVTWGALEPQKGVYDFSVIDNDLQYLKAMGKKLIIEIWWMQFGNSSTPSPEYFPQYMISEGGVKDAGFVATAKIDEAYWMDRLVALSKALAAKYDSDPAVEQFVLSETAATSAKEFLRALPTFASHWPKTAVVFYPNWVDSPEMARDLLAVMGRGGIGVGGPDLLPPPPINQVGEDHGSQALQGLGVRKVYANSSETGDFGTVDYRGRIPVAYQYQGIHSLPPTVLIDYALNTLKSTHITWTIAYDQGPEMNFDSGVMPVVKSVNGKINTALPTAFSQ